MGADHLGHSVAGARHPLVRIKTSRRTTGFESARIEDQRRFTAAPAAKRWDLSYTVLEQTLVVVSHFGAIHLRGIREDVRKADEGVAENEFIGHARVKDVGNRGRN